MINSNREALNIVYELERKYKGGILGIPDGHPKLNEVREWFNKGEEPINSAKNRYDWESIQRDLDKGLKKSEVADNNQISLSSLTNGMRQGLVNDIRWKKLTRSRFQRLGTMRKQERNKELAREQFKKYDWLAVQEELNKGTYKSEICRMFKMQTTTLKTAIDDQVVSDFRWKVVSKRIKSRKNYLKRKREASS